MESPFDGGTLGRPGEPSNPIIDLAPGAEDNPVLSWVTATGLRPVLDILTEDDERAAFLEPYTALLAEAYPRTPIGVLYPFRRVFAVGQKTG